MSLESLSHLDQKGRARMVDVTEKTVTLREAVASGKVIVGRKVFQLLMDGKLPKGDVLAVARVAGIMAAKRVDSLIPLCHPLPLQSIEVDFVPDAEDSSILVRAKARVQGVTGVEMEALTAVSVAALTIYDMCKSVEKGIIVERISLDYKSGGKSGRWIRSVSGGESEDGSGTIGVFPPTAAEKA